MFLRPNWHRTGKIGENSLSNREESSSYLTGSSASESSIPRKLARPCRNPRRAVLDLDLRATILAWRWNFSGAGRRRAYRWTAPVRSKLLGSGRGAAW